MLGDRQAGSAGRDSFDRRPCALVAAVAPWLGVLAVLVSARHLSAQTHRFVAVGDSRGSNNGVNSLILTEIAQAIVAENAEFVLFPGDLVTGSSNPNTLTSQLTNWRDHMQPVYDAGIGVYPCRGNHDAGSIAVWNNIFSGPYALPGNGPAGEVDLTYSVTHGSIFFVAMDVYVTNGRVNQTWLNGQFAANTQAHVFTFTHEPAFKCDHTDTLDDFPNNRNNFWNSIAAEGSRAYFCGHDHFYDHLRADDGDGDPDNDVHQYIVGTAGAPLYADGVYDGFNGPWTPVRVHHERQFGYVLVEINGPTATLTWKHRTSPGVYEATSDVFTYLVSLPCAADKDCDDGNPCTDDDCIADVCAFTNNTLSCEDATFCNGAETCADGACLAGEPPDCDDGIACTNDSCNEATDSCNNVADDDNCYNWVYCDGEETCDAVIGCLAGTAIDCDDGVGCTDDECNESADACTNVANNAHCDDGTYCNGAETCDAVLGCRAGAAIDCDDGVACTDDSCNETTVSCDHVVVDANCDDGAFCNGVETCDGILGCQAGTNPCPAGTTCDEDNDACVQPVPTVSAWGLMILALLLLVTGKVYFGRHRAQTAV